MKTILIQPISLFSREYIQNSIPTHLVILHTFLKQNNLESEILNLPSDGPKPPTDLKDLKRYYQDLVNIFSKYESKTIFGISCYTSLHYTASVLVAKAIKQALPQVKIVIGGYGVNFTKEDFLKFENLFDYIVIGEGEYELLRIIKNVKENNFPKNEHPKILYATQIDDLNFLEILNWDILESSKLYKENFVIVPYFNARGCPYGCKYCADMTNLKGYEKRSRFQSVDKSIKDIENLMQFFEGKSIGISFDEPIFGLDKHWNKSQFLNSLIRLVRSRQNIAFGLETRIGFINERDCELFSKIDMIMALGLENGSPIMLKKMNKTQHPDFYLKKMIENRDLLEKKQIHWNANIIFGYPGENLNTFHENLGFIEQLFEKTQYGLPIFQKYMFYPGSHVFRNVNSTEFNGMNVIYPEWYHLLYNGYDLGNLVDPSNELTFLEIFKIVSDFSSRFFKKVEQNYIQSPNSPLAYNYAKSIYLKNGLEYWPHIYQHFDNLMKNIRDNKLKLINIEQFFAEQYPIML